MWVVEEVTESSKVGYSTLANTSGSTTYNITGKPRQRNMAQMKEQIKTPKNKKIQQRDEEIANLSDVQFKTLVIRMLREMVEDGHKIEEEVKTLQSEIKKNIQGTNSEGKDTGTLIKDQRKE